MANSDNVQRLIVYLTAAIIAIGSLGLAVYVWMNGGERDLALIFGFLGTAFGSASTFLFLGERSTAAAKATERAVNAGALSAPMAPLGLYGAADLAGMPDAVEDEYVGDGDEPGNEDPALIDPDVPAEHRAPVG